MLSFIISNAMIVINSTIGISPVTLEQTTADQSYSKSISQAQTLIATGTPEVVVRDDIMVAEAPAPQTQFLSSQIAVQSLPASNSALVNAASKYIGQYLDCTAVIEYALRDLGYSVRDEAPMGFGAYGTVFYDPSQVQPGDILMRPGHVTLYAGDGMSIQGGFGFGGVVYTNWQATPEYYTAYVRLG